MDAAEIVYKHFYHHINEIPWPKYKIRKWDAGWWQIRMALDEAGIAQTEIANLKEKHSLLGKKILPKLYEFEFIQPDMNEFEQE